MEGVILFADDHIFVPKRPENNLFNEFNKEGNFPILPINNLENLTKTVSSISTFKALILDWNFERDKEDQEEGVEFPSDNPLEFLRSNKVYSLVYVYSQTDISQEIKDELTNLYNGKIYFESKNSSEGPENEFAKITARIKRFEEENKHLSVPFKWSHAINKSSQEIFSELELAEPNWISEISKAAMQDGAEPTTEVINIFHHLLNESIIQNESLLDAIRVNTQEDGAGKVSNEPSLAKLYQRIYYTKLNKDAPIMTGDIYKFSDDEYAILITPDCDIKTKINTALEFLVFNKNDFDVQLLNKMNDNSYNRNDFKQFLVKCTKTKDGKNEIVKEIGDLLKKMGNGNIISSHILPSFPFEVDCYNLSAMINFQTAFIVKNKAEFEEKRWNHKLNSPYIYQLRQRYLSYFGRVGVPAIPQNVKLYNMQ